MHFKVTTKCLTQRLWRLKMDLCMQPKFLEHITPTMLCADMVILSNTIKQVIILELTTPWEQHMRENMGSARSRCRRQDWKTFYDVVEMGCRGFAGRSLCRALTKRGLVGLEKKWATKSANNAAEKATKWLWLKRDWIWTLNSVIDFLFTASLP